MKRISKVLGMSTCLLAIAVFATSLTSDAMAQNASQNASGGLGVPMNAT